MLLLWLGLTAGEATTLEESIEFALRQSPTAQMGEEDLAMARHRMGTSVSRLLPSLSLSERQTYRYNNPEKYNYSFHYGGGECVPTPETPCLPYVVVDGQLMVPEAVMSNSLSLSMVQPVAASSVVGVLQQQQGKNLTVLKVRGDSEQLVGQLVNSYTELQYQAALQDILEGSLALAQEMAHAVQGMHAVGESTDLDVDKALLDVDEAQTNLDQLHRALPLYIEEHALLSGLDKDEPIRVCPFLRDPDRGEDLQVEEATKLEMLRTQVKVDRLNRTSSQLSLLPTLYLMGGMTYSGAGEDLDTVRASFYTYDSWYVGGMVSVSLFEGMGRYHSYRSAVSSLRKSRLELETEQSQLDLDDRQMALKLADLAEDEALARRSVDLAERNVVAVRSVYLDGGQTNFESYTQARKNVEYQQQHRLLLQRQQVQTMTMRWLNAGYADALLGRLYLEERQHADNRQCVTVGGSQ